MRRREPRPMAPLFAEQADRLAPATTLARVQRAWPTVAGAVVAQEAEPVAERDGTLTIECSSSVWAQEIELLSADLIERINGAVGEPGGTLPVRSLKVTATGVRRPFP